MKKLLLIGLSITIFSCGKSKEEELIASHVQKIGETKTDLSFKMISLDKVKDITAKDSLEILQSHFNEKKTGKLEELRGNVELYEEYIKKYKTKLEEENKSNTSIVEMYQEFITEYEADVKRNKEFIEKYEGDCKGTFLEPVLSSINEYKEKEQEILATKFDAVYSIKNPLLNDAKQEINKEFIVNAERTKIY